MKLSEKVKSYLIWGGVCITFGMIVQGLIFFLFTIHTYNQTALIGMSLFNWIVFGIMIHVWARDDPRRY